VVVRELHGGHGVPAELSDEGAFFHESIMGRKWDGAKL
jgi:hypothetical protein